jgi:hypothetical protein
MGAANGFFVVVFLGENFVENLQSPGKIAIQRRIILCLAAGNRCFGNLRPGL